MSVQLHLPDLPEVPVAIGTEPGTPCGPRLAWRARLRALLGAVLPVAVMALLALGSWWLVKNSPQPPDERVAAPARHFPDYRLERFTLQRYTPEGELQVQIEGERLRHYPDTDEIEVDRIHLHANSPDGRVTEATAREAVAAGDGSRVQLVGGAHVISQGKDGEVVELFGEQLLALVKERKVIANEPVRVLQGRTEYRAAGLELDETTRVVILHGPAHATLTPRAAKP